MSKWQASHDLLERARKSLAGGVSSPFRAKAPVPLYFRDGRGSRLWDEDGNEYIDYALAWGPAILGHCHPRLVEALADQATRPATLGA
ncbi:MAG: aminotransferase class III-fold pyridoxal phosphate-dependent enzyme, partial [bacterium]|nr:aminotransferase class III-fold pyridoxal phosphate-dependent enzyme [bacterium]